MKRVKEAFSSLTITQSVEFFFVDASLLKLKTQRENVRLTPTYILTTM